MLTYMPVRVCMLICECARLHFFLHAGMHAHGCNQTCTCTDTHKQYLSMMNDSTDILPEGHSHLVWLVLSVYCSMTSTSRSVKSWLCTAASGVCVDWFCSTPWISEFWHSTPADFQFIFSLRIEIIVYLIKAQNTNISLPSPRIKSVLKTQKTFHICVTFLLSQCLLCDVLLIICQYGCWEMFLQAHSFSR